MVEKKGAALKEGEKKFRKVPADNPQRSGHEWWNCKVGSARAPRCQDS